jgi:hypothetical protein
MARRKNTKFIDPRYFMDEKTERLDEADPHDQPAGGADSLAQKKAKCKGKWMEHGMEGFDGSRGWHGYCDEKQERVDEEELENVSAVNESLPGGDRISNVYPELGKALAAMGKAEGEAAGKELVWMAQWLRQKTGDKAAQIFTWKMFAGGMSMLQAANEALDESNQPEPFLKIMLQRYVGSGGTKAPRADDQNVTKGAWR